MFLIYLTFSFLIIFFEYKKYSSLISPASLMSISYFISFLFAKIGEIFFSYIVLDPKIYLLIIFVLFIGWMPSFLLPLEINKNTEIFRNKTNLGFSQKILLFLLLLFCLAALFFARLHGNIASESFETAYSHGIFAHFRNLFSILIVFILLFARKTKYSNLLVILCFILMFLSGTKYHVIFLFLPIILYSLDHPTKKILFRIFIVCLIGVFCLFAFNYIFSFFMNGIESEHMLEFLLNHFVMYVGGGIVGLSNLLFKNPTVHSGGFVLVDNLGVEQTNVFTIFGTFIQNYGIVISFLVLFIFSMLGYFLFFLYKNKNGLKKLSLFIAYCNFIGIPFLLSFFASYYRLSRTYELFILSFFCILFYQKSFFSKIFKYEVPKCFT